MAMTVTKIFTATIDNDDGDKYVNCCYAVEQDGKFVSDLSNGDPLGKLPNSARSSKGFNS